MEKLKQQFQGDLGLTPTALFYAQLYGDIHLTIEQAAPHLKLTAATIRNLICASKQQKKQPPVHFFKLGGKWVVHVNELAEYVNRMRHVAPEIKRRRGAPRKSERLAAVGS